MKSAGQAQLKPWAPSTTPEEIKKKNLMWICEKAQELLLKNK